MAHEIKYIKDPKKDQKNMVKSWFTSEGFLCKYDIIAIKEIFIEHAQIGGLFTHKVIAGLLGIAESTVTEWKKRQAFAEVVLVCKTISAKVLDRQHSKIAVNKIESKEINVKALEKRIKWIVHASSEATFGDKFTESYDKIDKKDIGKLHEFITNSYVDNVISKEQFTMLTDNLKLQASVIKITEIEKNVDNKSVEELDTLIASVKDEIKNL